MIALGKNLVKSYISSCNLINSHRAIDSMASNSDRKKVAGVVIFKNDSGTIKYLMLKPTKTGKEYSPPKGQLYEVHVADQVLESAVEHTKRKTGLVKDIDYNILDISERFDQKMKSRDPQFKEVTFFLGKLKTPNSFSMNEGDYSWCDKVNAQRLYASVVPDHQKFDCMLDRFEKYIIENNLLE